MDDKILTAMASDMKINKYTNESDFQFCNRILYSAIACWIKTVAADKVLGSADDFGVSRHHILNRCSSVLNEFLLRHPASYSWFLPEADEDNPVSLIRSRLIRHGDLLNVGFNTNLILAKEKIVPTCESFATYKGLLISSQTSYSGISVIGPPLPVDASRPEIQDSVSWFNEYVRSAWWEKCSNPDENIQYYNAGKPARNNYSGWQSVMPAPINGFILTRKTINNAGYEYCLLKEQSGIQYMHRLDSFMQETGEYRKMMFALRCLADNKVPCQVNIQSDHVLLKIWVHLPQNEFTLLESYAWPHNSVSDVLEWDMQVSIWSFIRPCFEALGFVIMEA